MNHRHVHHRLAHARVPLIVLAQSPIDHEPTKRPLHDPSFRQHSETHCSLHSTHDLQDQTINDSDTSGCLLATIAAIRPNLLQARKALLGLIQHGLATILILNIGRMDHTSDQHPQDIDQHMPLSTAHLFPAIIAALTAALRGLDRLAVEDGCGRGGLLTGLAADGRVQRVVKTQPQAIATPAREVGGHRAPRGKVVRQLAPLTSGAFQIEEGVENTAII